MRARPTLARTSGKSPPGVSNARSGAREGHVMFGLATQGRAPRTRRGARRTGTIVVAVASLVVAVLALPAQADLSRTAFELDRNALAGAAAGDDWSLIDDGFTDPNNDDSADASSF